MWQKSIFKLLVLIAGEKEEDNLGNFRLFSLILLPGKIMEYILESISKHKKEKK